MKVFIFSESPADEAALLTLTAAVNGEPVESVPGPRLRSRGWTGVFGLLPTVLKHLHFRTDAEAAAVVVNSDFQSVHLPSHDSPGGEDASCRLCALRTAVSKVLATLSPVPNRPVLKVAIGLAVPAIEAWYLCGRDRRVSEAAWITGLQTRKFPYTKNELKKAVYGTDRPSIERETESAVKEATRVSKALEALEAFFPNGFGPFARGVRSWKQPAPS
jgi:hypothetical protein